MHAKELLSALYDGRFDDALRPVYGAQGLKTVYGRIESVVHGFCQNFDPNETCDLSVFSAPGRTELAESYLCTNCGDCIDACKEGALHFTLKGGDCDETK